jgi:hypothetical protein
LLILKADRNAIGGKDYDALLDKKKDATTFIRSFNLCKCEIGTIKALSS